MDERNKLLGTEISRFILYILIAGTASFIAIAFELEQLFHIPLGSFESSQGHSHNISVYDRASGLDNVFSGIKLAPIKYHFIAFLIGEFLTGLSCVVGACLAFSIERSRIFFGMSLIILGFFIHFWILLKINV